MIRMYSIWIGSDPTDIHAGTGNALAQKVACSVRQSRTAPSYLILGMC